MLVEPPPFQDGGRRPSFPVSTPEISQPVNIIPKTFHRLDIIRGIPRHRMHIFSLEDFAPKFLLRQAACSCNSIISSSRQRKKNSEITDSRYFDFIKDGLFRLMWIFLEVGVNIGITGVDLDKWCQHVVAVKAFARVSPVAQVLRR